MKKFAVQCLCALLAMMMAVSLLAGCSENKEADSSQSSQNSDMSADNDSEEAYEVEQDGQGFYAYLDYAEKSANSISLEFVLGGVNATFAEDANAEAVSFDGDLADAANAQLSPEGDATTALLTAEIPLGENDVEALSLEGSITLAKGALLDNEGNSLEEPCCVTNVFTYSGLDKAIGDEIKAEKKTDWKLSQKGFELIKKYEPCRLTTWRTPGGTNTIGYGHTANVTPGMTITQKQAEDFLWEDVTSSEGFVKKMLKDGVISFDLNQNQFDALVCLTFNIGAPNAKEFFRRSTTAEDMAKNILKYNKSGGKVSDSLTARRQAEQELFLDPYE